MGTEMSLEISQETQTRLYDEAQREGVSVDALLRRLMDERQTPSLPYQGESATDASVAAAVRRSATFGQRHGLSLGGMTIKELLRESRP